MTEQSKASETPQPAIDMTKYVSKDDFEKVQKTAADTSAKLKSELEQAKMSLLDPEYISYLEAKKSQATKGVTLPDTGDADIDKMTPKQLLAYALTKAVETVETRLDGRFRRSEQTLSDVLAVMELQNVEKKYEDFPEYRDKVVALLEDPKSNLTIEQAYKIAKSENPASEGDTKKADSKSRKAPEGEKPSGSRPESFQPKSFKTKEDASNDAWDRVVGAGKETL